MIYAILAIIASLGGVGAWVYKLIKNNETLRQLLVGKAIDEELKIWADKIKEIEGKTKTDEEAYEEAKKKFNGSNGSGGGEQH